MYCKTLTDRDKELGFQIEEIADDYADSTGKPILINAVVKQISTVERLIKIISPDGVEKYLHQWKRGNSWCPCCSHEISKDLSEFEYLCSQYSEFEIIILNSNDKAEINHMVLNDRNTCPVERIKKNSKKRNLLLRNK